jgi:hypothetical protein
MDEKRKAAGPDMTWRRQSGDLGRRWKLIGVVLAISLTVSFLAATSILDVSTISMTVTNSGSHQVVLKVLLDDSQKGALLNPSESVTFVWSVTAWTHRYAVLAHEPEALVMWAPIWTHVLVLPFSETSLEVIV